MSRTDAQAAAFEEMKRLGIELLSVSERAEASSTMVIAEGYLRFALSATAAVADVPTERIFAALLCQLYAPNITQAGNTPSTPGMPSDAMCEAMSAAARICTEVTNVAAMHRAALEETPPSPQFAFYFLCLLLISTLCRNMQVSPKDLFAEVVNDPVFNAMCAVGAEKVTAGAACDETADAKKPRVH